MDSKTEKTNLSINVFEKVNHLFEDISREALSDKKGSEKVEAIASHILISKGCVRTKNTDDSTTLSPKEIFAEHTKLSKTNDMGEIPENTFRQMLSQLSKEDGSIYLWQDDNRKYFFKYNVDDESSEDIIDATEAIEKSTYEKDVYPILQIG